MTRLLITGGAGFIASHLIDHVLKTTDWQIVVLDKFTYASNGLQRLKEIGAYDNPRVAIHVVDISRRMSTCLEKEIGPVTYIVHMAAGTHVDNSIICPRDFLDANVGGTLEMLEYARRVSGLKKFHYFSTDEVFRPAPLGVEHKEWDNYNSTNPYAATKAAGEELSLAWANTFRVPVLVTHTMNVFGERQHPEKYIPKVVQKVLAGEKLTIHGSPQGASGSRFYLHGSNVAPAVLFLLQHGKNRDKYNIVGEKEISNLELAQAIAAIIGKPLTYEIVDFHSSRPGHDLRYGLNGTKLKEMGFEMPFKFEDSLNRTIQWMLRAENAHWLKLASKYQSAE
jgi:dTDP-glucose 4,6-dehydratase